MTAWDMWLDETEVEELAKRNYKPLPSKGLNKGTWREKRRVQRRKGAGKK